MSRARHTGAEDAVFGASGVGVVNAGTNGFPGAVQRGHGTGPEALPEQDLLAADRRLSGLRQPRGLRSGIPLVACSVRRRSTPKCPINSNSRFHRAMPVRGVTHPAGRSSSDKSGRLVATRGRTSWRRGCWEPSPGTRPSPVRAIPCSPWSPRCSWSASGSTRGERAARESREVAPVVGLDGSRSAAGYRSALHHPATGGP